MWETIQTVIKGLPAWYLMVLIPALAATGIWVFTHVRRDKAGKLYWFSRRYEDGKHVRKLDAITDGMKGIRMDVLRLNVWVESLPMAERMASGIRYLKAGGNGETRAYIETELRGKDPALYASLEKIVSG
jgi:hypothetical protein